MHGVTTALVGFIFVCVVFPNLIKNRTQYYAALVAVCVIIVLDALGLAISGSDMPIRGFRVFAYVANAFLQVAAIVLLYLSAGGISWRAFASDMKEAYEVIRRGGDEKEVIIPLSPEMQRLREQRQAAARASSGAANREPGERERINIEDPSIPPVAPAPAAPSPAASNEPSP